jgi:hypothetical protein
MASESVLLAQPRARHDRRAALAIFLAFFGLYLLTTSRERPWTDAKAIHQVAENLVESGSFHINVVWPPDSPPGRNGLYYAVNPILTSLVHVPGAAIQRAIATRWPEAAPLALPLTSHLAPAALGALTCALFFLLCRQERISFVVASLSTLLCGLATSLWVYARYPYSEIAQAACFTGLLLALVQIRDAERVGRPALWLGLWASALVNTKLAFSLSVLVAALFILWWNRRDGKRLLHAWIWLGVGCLPGAVLAGFYNWVRWGSVVRSGYDPFLGEFFGHGQLAVGLWGLFLSPGTSVFLYSPPLVLALFGLGEMLHKRRSSFCVALATPAPLIVLSASYAFWMGGWNWGPRYLVFALPAFLLPAAFLLERLWAFGRRPLLVATCATALGIGAVVQVAGNAFYWDHFIRIAQEARLNWLGTPNRGGSIPRNIGGNCHACFEDMYAVNWLPPFQPIVGHLWLLRHVPFGHDWQRAERDAPWRRFTSMPVSIAGTYGGARIDWWMADLYPYRGVASVLVLTMLALMGSGAVLWMLTGMRKRRTQAAPPVGTATGVAS